MTSTDLNLKRLAPAVEADRRARAAADRLAQAAAAHDLLDVAVTKLDSPIGELFVAVTPRGLAYVAFEDEDRDQVMARLARELSPRILEHAAATDTVRRELDEYFAGERRRFDVPLDRRLIRGIARDVLAATARGAVRPHDDLRRARGEDRPTARPRARSATPWARTRSRSWCRATGCCGTGGALGGYAGGLARKERLLRLEGVPGGLTARHVHPVDWRPRGRRSHRKTNADSSGSGRPGDDVARLTYFGLFAQQHRGQESAGHRGLRRPQHPRLQGSGPRRQVFNEATLTTLHGDLAIGHTRYSTTGSTTWDNAQPVFKTDGVQSLALGHNGNLVNTDELVARLGTLRRRHDRLRPRGHDARVRDGAPRPRGGGDAGAARARGRVLLRDDGRALACTPRATPTASGRSRIGKAPERLRGRLRDLRARHRRRRVHARRRAGRADPDRRPRPPLGPLRPESRARPSASSSSCTWPEPTRG